MTNTHDTSKILDKIKKCLELSKSTNANEAAVALKQAKALMEKYAIDEIDIKISVVAETETHSSNTKSIKNYEASLANLVAREFNCELIINHVATKKWNGKSHKRSWAFVGLKPYNEIAAYVFDVLNSRLKKDRLNYVKYKLIGFYDKGLKTQRANAFCDAWVYRISTTVKDFAERKNPHKEIVDHYLAKKYPDIGESVESKKTKNYNGSNLDRKAGFEQAEGVYLHDAVHKEEIVKIGY